MRSYFSFSILFSLSAPLFNCCGRFDTYKGFLVSVFPENVTAKYKVGIALKKRKCLLSRQIFSDQLNVFLVWRKKKGRNTFFSLQTILPKISTIRKNPIGKEERERKESFKLLSPPPNFFPFSFLSFSPLQKRQNGIKKERKKEGKGGRDGWKRKTKRNPDSSLPI